MCLALVAGGSACAFVVIPVYAYLLTAAKCMLFVCRFWFLSLNATKRRTMHAKIILKIINEA